MFKPLSCRREKTLYYDGMAMLTIKHVHVYQGDAKSELKYYKSNKTLHLHHKNEERHLPLAF